MRHVALLLSIALCAMVAPAHGADAASRFRECQREAQELSGYYGQEARGFVSGALRGGLGGAALGAAGGWVTDSDTKKTAKRGVALGALIGGARAAAQKRKVDEKRELYDRALQRCMDREQG
ncbi:MAG: hypothetical protein V2J02_22055 [Pseudomonadales bacterium]|jgi:hypothetical protein|nr:hypothetical protein [Pseudomonadales bacterium]